MIDQIRKKIDLLDRSILKLLNQRFILVKELAKEKPKEGLPVRDKEREREILERLREARNPILSDEEIGFIWKAILVVSSRKQGRSFRPGKLCVSILATDAKSLKDMLLLSVGKVDMVELRLDLFRESLDSILPIENLETIATCRKKEEGGHFEGSEKDRIKVLEKASELGVDYIDVELSTPEELIKEVKSLPSKLILSKHVLHGTPSSDELLSILKKMVNSGADICKIVTVAKSMRESMVVLESMGKASTLGKPVILHAMGTPGRITRLLSPFFGAPFVYTCPERSKETADGQMTPEELELIWLFLDYLIN